VVFVVLAFLEALPPMKMRRVEPCIDRKIRVVPSGECSIFRQRLHVGVLFFEGGKVKIWGVM